MGGYFEESIIEQGVEASRKTVEGAVAALVQTFNYSPFGSILTLGVDNGDKTMIRQPYDDISDKGLAYSIYKFAEMQGIRSLRIADFYTPECLNGPFKTMGISKSTFERTLRALNSSSNRLLTADLNMGLDNITLRDDINSLSIITME